MLWSISLWRYFSDSYGVSVGKCLACIIHWVSSGVGVRWKFYSVFLRCICSFFSVETKISRLVISYSHGGKYVLNFGLLRVWQVCVVLNICKFYLVYICHLGHL